MGFLLWLFFRRNFWFCVHGDCLDQVCFTCWNIGKDYGLGL
jgi:hypothetical protein